MSSRTSENVTTVDHLQEGIYTLDLNLPCHDVVLLRMRMKRKQKVTRDFGRKIAARKERTCVLCLRK